MRVQENVLDTGNHHTQESYRLVTWFGGINRIYRIPQRLENVHTKASLQTRFKRKS